MDALPLPSRPSLEQYRKRAKDLVKACESEDPEAVRGWAADWLEALRRQLHEPLTPFVRDSMSRATREIEARLNGRSTNTEKGKQGCTLADAQFLIAQAHGFDRWADFAHHVEAHGRDGSSMTFESAADAIVSGDLSALETLIRANPNLIRARSGRSHHVTLLHYVAANGVEDFRQRSPQNAPEIARFLLEQGADVDAVASTYGGGNQDGWGTDKDQTTLNLLVSSVHPAEAGVQVLLVDTLLDFGAAVDGLEQNGSPLFTALAFGYLRAAEALVRRGARLDHIVAAAALGRADIVRHLIDGDNLVSERSLLAGPPWLRLPKDARGQAEFALAWACKFGRPEVARLLLNAGVDPAAKDRQDMTALHWAAANGLTDIVALLLKQRAPLEAVNTWGGTVLNSTLHFALYMPVEGVDYPVIIETLLAAGADVSVVNFPTGHAAIDDVLRRYGASAPKTNGRSWPPAAELLR